MTQNGDAPLEWRRRNGEGDAELSTNAARRIAVGGRQGGVHRVAGGWGGWVGVSARGIERMKVQ